jgi:acetolactate synthase-1/2/3 large subunit
VQLEGFPDVANLADAYGFKGEIVEKPEDLAPALERAVAEPGPYLLCVKVTPMECVYPMVPAGSGLSEMVLGPPMREAAVAK